jgi:hypothetical protein
MWDMGFISEEDLRAHVTDTIRAYAGTLASYDLKRFNKNIVDPIKLLLDRSVYGMSWEETVKSEIFRQRDKSNNNKVGYFHQKIFNYIADCEVPQQGWDVIYSPAGGIEVCSGIRVSTVYVEMKNKHNTMNAASAGKTYMEMQGQLLRDDDCACMLVETVAKRSQNSVWEVTVNKQKQKHNRIRRVSLDRFYEMVTGDPNAFYKVCAVLPSVIDYVLHNTPDVDVANDTAADELLKMADNDEASVPAVLYSLGFHGYVGFPE